MTAELRPDIVITMGDAAGIGPETVVKALGEKDIYEACRPVVVGDLAVMRSIARALGLEPEVSVVEEPSWAAGRAGTIDVIDLKNLGPDEVKVGQVCAPCGRAAMEYIEAAARLALEGKAAAVVTAPINKEATAAAGYGDVGHLEYFARITQTKEYATMLASGRLRVVHLTTHYSLLEACGKVTKERILAKLELSRESFEKWGTPRPTIGVAALNPHGGESGMFGREEIEQIIPAVEEARKRGIDARGPYPADSIFNRAINGEFDVVLAMYHDQGHIPVKVHGFEKSVSVALGLPFIRTSVDHGTAFDIAGKGLADERSMAEAILMAARLARGRGLGE